MNATTTRFLLASLFTFSVGCGAERRDDRTFEESVVEGSLPDEKADGSRELPVQRDWSGYLGAPRNLAKIDRRTITTEASFVRVFGEEPPPWLDLDRTWIVVYTAGEQATNGFRAHIEGVRLSRTGSSIEIETQLRRPEAACIVDHGKTTPYTIVGIPNPGTRPQSVRYYAADADPSCMESACAAAVLSELEAASKSLIYTSEGDYPFEARLFAGAGAALDDDAALLEALGEPADANVERRETADWFSLRTASDDDDAYSQQIAAAYSRLRDTVQTELTDVQVVRVGEIQIHVYIVGRTSCGDLAGVSTVSIET